MSRIVSFRGLIGDGEQDTIPLSTNNGSTGYRIKKIDIIDSAPGTASVELILKIYSIPQTSVDGLIDFSDNTLLAIAYFADSDSLAYQGLAKTIIFDNMVFNQDIYITATDVSANSNTNYYIELEQMPLDLNENTVATLKDIRNIARTV
jgi:hypothetical protein